jgi:hypothetical protein
MKKIALTFALILVTIITVFASHKNDREFILKLGVQPLSTLTAKQQGQNSANTNTGVSAGLEYFQYVSNIFAVGLGAQYDLPRKEKDAVGSSNTEFSFMPLFAALKVRIPPSGLDNTFMFVSGRLGCSVPRISNLDAGGTSSQLGLYYGAGIGFSIECFVVEGIYARNNFSLQNNEVLGDSKVDANLETITLSVGYKFDI